MPRLFVALDLPEDLKQDLLRLQPLPQRGVRLTKTSQLHVTLHFLGEMPARSVIDALAEIRLPEFSLQFAGVGRFSNRRGPIILWAGIEPSSALTNLHSALGEALRITGYLSESRPYAPHITLARCEPGMSDAIVREFLSQHANWSGPAISITEFRLYSSELTEKGSVYSPLRSFMLTPTA